MNRRAFFSRLSGALLGGSVTAAAALPDAPVEAQSVGLLRSPDEERRIVDAVIRAMRDDRGGIRSEVAAIASTERA